MRTSLAWKPPVSSPSACDLGTAPAAGSGGCCRKCRRGGRPSLPAATTRLPLRRNGRGEQGPAEVHTPLVFAPDRPSIELDTALYIVSRTLPSERYGQPPAIAYFSAARSRWLTPRGKCFSAFFLARLSLRPSSQRQKIRIIIACGRPELPLQIQPFALRPPFASARFASTRPCCGQSPHFRSQRSPLAERRPARHSSDPGIAKSLTLVNEHTTVTNSGRVA